MTTPHALAWLRVFCTRMKLFHVLNIAPPPTWNPGCAPAVLSLQCQTFGIQIRLDILFGLIWVQPVSKDYYFAGFTTGIAADIVRLVLSRRINKLKLKVGALI